MKIKTFALLLVLMLLLTACGRATTQTQDKGETGNQASQGENQTSENGQAQPEPGDEDAQSSQDDPAESTQGNENTQPSQGGTSQNDGDDPSSDGQPSGNELLAALTIYGLSLEYFDFELQGIYEAASEMDGIYAVFTSGGMDYVAHVCAINEERTASGTRDLHSPEVGYAAFDLVDALPDGVSAMDASRYTAAFDYISMPAVYSH